MSLIDYLLRDTFEVETQEMREMAMNNQLFSGLKGEFTAAELDSYMVTIAEEPPKKEAARPTGQEIKDYLKHICEVPEAFSL